MRLALFVLALGGAVWTVVLRFTTGLRAPLCDRLPVTAGLACAAAALVLPVVSLGADGRLARLARRRRGRLPRWPILTAKGLVCLGAWAVVALCAAAVAFLCSPSLECIHECVRVLDGGWLWALLLFASSFFASAATGRVPTILALAVVLGALPPLAMRYVFELPVGAGGGLATKAIVGGAATLWLFGAALLALPIRLAAPATLWAKALAQLKSGLCAAAAGLGMALVAPAAVVVACLLLRQEDATRLSAPQLSPNGRFLAFDADVETWPFPAPAPYACVLDTATCQTLALTRIRRSCLPLPSPWSPQGRYLVYWVGQGPLAKGWRIRTSNGVEGVNAHVCAILDTQTGETQEATAEPLPIVFIKVGEDGVVTAWGIADEEAASDLTRRWYEYVYHWDSRTWRKSERALTRAEVSDRMRAPGTWRLMRPPESSGNPDEVYPWQLDDPHGRGLSLALRPHENALGKPWGAQLTSDRGRTWKSLGGFEDAYDVKPYCGFSRGGRWLTYAIEWEEDSLAVWLLEVGSGEARKLSAPGPVRQWQPRVTPDDTRLVWLSAYAAVRQAHGEQGPCFYVQDLPSGQPRRVDLPGRGQASPDSIHFAGPDDKWLYFVREARLWRVALDGSGAELLFPR